MKKIIKTITILIILVTLSFSCFNVLQVFAAQSLVPDVNYYKLDENATIPNEVTDVGNTIVGLIQVIGTIIAVVTLMIMGIKYMAASVEEKANYKKTMIPYIIGCILLFATVTIVSAIYQLIEPLNQ